MYISICKICEQLAKSWNSDEDEDEDNNGQNVAQVGKEARTIDKIAVKKKKSTRASKKDQQKSKKKKSKKRSKKDKT